MMADRLLARGHALPWSRRRFAKAWSACWMILRGDTSKYPEVVTTFEREFAAYVGCPHGVTFCNGTSCLDAALFALNLKTGDRVLVPALTFHASISPVLNAGAEPVFVDVDPITGNVSLVDFERKAAAGASGAVITHLWGNPTDMDAVSDVARRYEMRVIEDCSLAHGAAWKGRKVGSFGDIGFFSLQAEKAVAAGEAGIAVTKDRLLSERMLLFGHYNRGLSESEIPDHRYYPVSGVGHKRRAHPLGIALAQVDFRHLERDNRRRRQAIGEVSACVRDLPGVRLLGQENGATPGGFTGFIPLLLNDQPARETVKTLKREGIPAARLRYPAWHLDPFFAHRAYRESLLAPRPSFTPDVVDAARRRVPDECPNMRGYADRLAFLTQDIRILRRRKQEIQRILAGDH